MNVPVLIQSNSDWRMIIKAKLVFTSPRVVVVVVAADAVIETKKNH